MKMRLVLLLTVLASVLSRSVRTSNNNPSGITDIEAFKRDEMREPVKSWLEYFIQGARGLKDGYFVKFRHGKIDKRDELCFGKEAETQIY